MVWVVDFPLLDDDRNSSSFSRKSQDENKKREAQITVNTSNAFLSIIFSFMEI